MSDEEALLVSIIANPDEDTPRLMYADWLTENGDHDRAEFIRLQCEIAKHPRTSDTCLCGYEPRDGYHHNSPMCPYLRERELLALHEKEWRAGPKCDRCVDGYEKSPKTGRIIEQWCRHCDRTGDGGGLLQTFNYEGYVGEHNGDPEPVRIDWSRYPLLGVQVPHIDRCVDTRVFLWCPTCKAAKTGTGWVCSTCGNGNTSNLSAPTLWLETVAKQHKNVISCIPRDREPFMWSPSVIGDIPEEIINRWFFALKNPQIAGRPHWIPECLSRQDLWTGDVIWWINTPTYATRDQAIRALGRAVMLWVRSFADLVWF